MTIGSQAVRDTPTSCILVHRNAADVPIRTVDCHTAAIMRQVPSHFLSARHSSCTGTVSGCNNMGSVLTTERDTPPLKFDCDTTQWVADMALSPRLGSPEHGWNRSLQRHWMHVSDVHVLKCFWIKFTPGLWHQPWTSPCFHCQKLSWEVTYQLQSESRGRQLYYGFSLMLTFTFYSLALTVTPLCNLRQASGGCHKLHSWSSI